MKGKEDVFVGSLLLSNTRVYSREDDIGDDGLSIIHSCSSCVRDVTKRSELVFLSLMFLLLYFISFSLESLGFLGASWSILNTRVRVSSRGDIGARVL